MTTPGLTVIVTFSFLKLLLLRHDSRMNLIGHLFRSIFGGFHHCLVYWKLFSGKTGTGATATATARENGC